MADLTDEQREAALREMLSAWRGVALSDGATNRSALAAALDALIAQGWGPVAEAEARGYRAGVEAGLRMAADVCDIRASEYDAPEEKAQWACSGPIAVRLRGAAERIRDLSKEIGGS